VCGALVDGPSVVQMAVSISVGMVMYSAGYFLVVNDPNGLRASAATHDVIFFQDCPKTTIESHPLRPRLNGNIVVNHPKRTFDWHILRLPPHM